MRRSRGVPSRRSRLPQGVEQRSGDSSAEQLSMVQLIPSYCKEASLHSCPADFHRLTSRAIHKPCRSASRRLYVTASTGRHKGQRCKSDSTSRTSQPQANGSTSTSYAKPAASPPEMLARQPSLIAPMSAFFRRLSWSLQRVIPDRGLRKTLSSRRLSASSYIFADIHKQRTSRSRRGSSDIGPVPQSSQPGLRAGKQHKIAAPIKGQPSSRASGLARSTAQADIALADSSITVTPAKSSALPFLTEATGAALDGWHKPIGLVLVSAHTLATTCHLSGAPWLACSCWQAETIFG